MEQLREAAEIDNELAGAVLDNMFLVKALLSNIISRLNLKGNLFETFPLSSNSDIEDCDLICDFIDTTL